MGLKRAYQELLLRFHPDKTGGNECEAFINIQEAWQILGDEEHRARYNAQLANQKLDAEQDAAISATFKLQDLEDCRDGDVGVQCRCGGFYKGERWEIEEAVKESDVLLDCDTCSLQILVTLDPCKLSLSADDICIFRKAKFIGKCEKYK